MNSLLSACGAGFCEAWPALREGPSLNGRRHSSHALPTMLLRAGLRSNSPIRAEAQIERGVASKLSLRQQQPPPPRSTRLKGRRLPRSDTTGRTATPTAGLGPTSFLDIGMTAAADRGGRTPLTLFDTEAVATGAGPRLDRMQGPWGSRQRQRALSKPAQTSRH